ncbi:hypothetical protein [uncultured Gammaproteobacteria bacterium]|nr:hypothetical protein [uncultured Gammaproteobacteria bacterium]
MLATKLSICESDDTIEKSAVTIFFLRVLNKIKLILSKAIKKTTNKVASNSA